MELRHARRLFSKPNRQTFNEIRDGTIGAVQEVTSVDVHVVHTHQEDVKTTVEEDVEEDVIPLAKVRRSLQTLAEPF